MAPKKKKAQHGTMPPDEKEAKPLHGYRPKDLIAWTVEEARMSNKNHPKSQIPKENNGCRRCPDLISKKKLALLPKTFAVNGSWYHPHCVVFLEVEKDDDAKLIEGFSALKIADQTTLNALVKEAKKKDKEMKEQEDKEQEEENNKDEKILQAEVTKWDEELKKNWEEYYEDMLKYLPRLLKDGSEKSSSKMGVCEDLFNACIKYYFKQALDNPSQEVSERLEKYTRYQVTLPADEDDQKKYLNLLKLRLLDAMQVMHWTKEKKFNEISSQIGMNEETVTYFVDLFISFSKFISKGETSTAKTQNGNAMGTLQSPSTSDVKAVDDADDDGVVFTRATYKGEYISFDNVDPNKVRRRNDYDALETSFLRNPEPIYLDCHVKGSICETHFWKELVPFEFEGNIDGWLSDDHINAWVEVLIRDRRDDDHWTVAKATLASYSPGSSLFLLVIDSALQGTLSGQTRPYPSWDKVEMVFMPIHAGGNHWVTAVVNLVDSTITVFDSLASDTRKDFLRKHIFSWTKVLNESLDMQGYFEVSGRQQHNFTYSYNDSNWFPTPQQENFMDCGVITCWLIQQFCNKRIPPPVILNPLEYFRQFRVTMAKRLYLTRCEDTTECGYD